MVTPSEASTSPSVQMASTSWAGRGQQELCRQCLCNEQMQLVEKLADATGCLLEIFGTMLGKVWYLSNLKVRPQLCTYRIRECDLLTEFHVFLKARASCTWSPRCIWVYSGCCGKPSLKPSLFPKYDHCFQYHISK